MPALTDDEEEAFEQIAELNPDHAAIMRESWAAMPDEARARFVRFAERLARLPPDIEPTKAQLDTMFENDTDFPLH